MSSVGRRLSTLDDKEMFVRRVCLHTPKANAPRRWDVIELERKPTLRIFAISTVNDHFVIT